MTTSPEAAKAAALIVSASTGGAMAPNTDAEIARGAAAVFPVKAKDLLGLGFVQGPALGAQLERCKDEWIASDFRLTRDDLLAGVQPPEAGAR